MNDLVSIIITTKDRHKHLLRAVQSVINQTYEKIEIIIVDDGSANEVRIDSIDHRIKIIRNKESIGAPKSRNLGMKKAQGQYIGLLDDDDYYLPHKIEKLLSVLVKDPSIDLAFSKTIIVDYDSNEYFIPINYYYKYNMYSNFMDFNRIHTNSTLFKKEIIKDTLFSEELLKFQDTQFHFDICLKYKVTYVFDEIGVCVWDSTPQKDRITNVNYSKNYASMLFIIDRYKSILNGNLMLKSNYYSKLFYYAFKSNNIKGLFLFLSTNKNILFFLFNALFGFFIFVKMRDYFVRGKLTKKKMYKKLSFYNVL